MAFRLVIAEKPSMAQTIAAALGIKGKQDGYIEGGGYLISWCVGHFSIYISFCRTLSCGYNYSFLPLGISLHINLHNLLLFSSICH